MGFFSDLNQWLLAEWIWSMTWGLYHVPLATVCMMLLFRWYVKLSLKRSVVLSIAASFCAMVVYTLYVPVLLIFVFGTTTDWVAEPLPAALYLGIIYGFLQSCFFWVFSCWSPLNLRPILLVIAISNFIAAFVIYKVTLVGLSL